MNSIHRPVRILFDAYWWVSGPPSNRRVMRETITEWLTEFPEDKVAVLVRRRDVEIARHELSSAATVFGTRIWPHGASNVSALATTARRWHAEVVYAQNFASVVPGALTVVFLHDVLWATNPEWFTRVELAYFRAMRPLAKHAGLILTSSHTEANRIRRATKARHVYPVGLGVSNELMAVEPSPPIPSPEPGRFLLTVGRLNIRKNLSGVINAALISGVVSARRPLLVVGVTDGRGEPLPANVADAIASGAVRFTGHVSDAELAWLYRECALFIFLTRGEGYGMPALESLYFGAPALVSDIDVFAEIVPSTIPRVDPDDVAAAAAAIRAIIAGEYVATAILTEPPTWRDSIHRMRAAILSRLTS